MEEQVRNMTDTSPSEYRHIRCNLCGADDYNVVFEAKTRIHGERDLAVRFRSSGDERLVDRVVRCRSCGLIYINPVLDPSLILTGYAEGTDETFVSQNRGRARTFAKGLRFIERYLHAPGLVLDVGTAGGTFLDEASKRGWKTMGCEPNKWLAKWADTTYGIHVHAGTIFDIPLKNESCDLITLWDVLEHTPDPKAVLQRCHRLLKPGGLLVVNIPDVGSWLARFMGKHWPFYLSVHLFYFTATTCKRMLELTGFQTVHQRPHIQYLECGYVLHRAEATVGRIASVIEQITRILHIDQLMVPYWMGQTLLIAKRASTLDSVHRITPN